MRRLPLKKWTEDIALRETNERMRKIEQLLGEVAYLWGDEDEYIVSRCDELARVVEAERLDFVASVQARVEERAEQRKRSMTQASKERIRVYFEEHGQDFSWWDLEDSGDDYSYRVVDCGPFQAWHWTRYFVAKDSVMLGKRLLISDDGKTARHLKYPVRTIKISLARGSAA